MLENKTKKLPNWKEKHDCIRYETNHVKLQRAQSQLLEKDICLAIVLTKFNRLCIFPLVFRLCAFPGLWFPASYVSRFVTFPGSYFSGYITFPALRISEFVLVPLNYFPESNSLVPLARVKP